jgi:hypothetical protein
MDDDLNEGDESDNHGDHTQRRDRPHSSGRGHEQHDRCEGQQACLHETARTEWRGRKITASTRFAILSATATLTIDLWRLMSLKDVLVALREEERQVALHLSTIRTAIAALGSNIGYIATGRGGPKQAGRPKGVRKRKPLSAKARAAISRAQKARWAKVRAAKK